MVLGESAGVASTLALDAKIPVQTVPYQELCKKLDALGQTLEQIPPQAPESSKGD